MTAPKEWRLHFGLHKTATTHLQDTLYHQREALAEAGISVVPRVASRDASLGRIFCGIGWRGYLPVAVRRQMGSAVLHRLGCAGPVIVWSEENLIGKPEDLILDLMYPRMESRLRSLAAATDGGRRHLFLSIRDPAAMLPSIYAQSLRAGPPAVGFDELLRRWLQRPPQWSGLAARIRAALPGDTLTVWTLGAYAADPQRILAAFVGIDRDLDLALPPPLATRRPSAEAIAALEALPRVLRPSVWRAQAATIFGTDPGQTVFDPLTPSQRELLAHAHLADLGALRAAGVVVV
jgi:hypothetical protein